MRPDTYKQELVGNAKESRLDYSDHEMFKIRMLRGGNKEDSRIVHSDVQEVKQE